MSDKKNWNQKMRDEYEIVGRTCQDCDTKLVETIDDNGELNGHWTCPNLECARGWLLTAAFKVTDYRIKTGKKEDFDDYGLSDDSDEDL